MKPKFTVNRNTIQRAVGNAINKYDMQISEDLYVIKSDKWNDLLEDASSDIEELIDQEWEATL